MKSDALMLAAIYSVMVLLAVVILNLPSYFAENIKLVMLMFIGIVMLASTGAFALSKKR